MVKILRNPDLYHGTNNSKNFFEGWYFKIADAAEKNIFAIIPGIYIGKNSADSHSFIQILNGENVEYSYLKYDYQDFSCKSGRFNININQNIFAKQGIELNIDKEGIFIRGKLYFHNTIKWKDSFLNPGSMGYYNYIPFMQCYSQVCALGISLDGSLKFNNRIINFTNGKGYIEKNWGNSFPYSWIWVQCNNFKKTKSLLTCSIGHIPFLFSSFRGFLIGLYFNEKLYKFTTMNKSKISIIKSSGDVKIKVENTNYILKIKTQSNKEDFMLCMGPKDGVMIPLVKENLKGIVYIELFDKSLKKTLLEDIGYCCGIEYGGEQMMIFDKI